MKAKQFFTTVTHDAGITINGDKPYDIQVNDESAYNCIFASGRLALGESFMDKQWDCDDLATAVSMLFDSGADKKFRSPSTVWLALKARLLNLQSRHRAFQVGTEHYDYGNDMYRAMLGPSMIYTCGIQSSDSDTLDQAQENKMHAICRALDVQPGDRLLDIGCGWGGFMRFAAQNYGAHCVGLSVSSEQIEYGRAWCDGLPIEFVVSDYRDYHDNQGFDHVVSVEMFEHVGPKNHRIFFKKVHSLLKPGGKHFIQVIGSPDVVPQADPWIDKYIFPNGILPSIPQLERAARGLFHWDSLNDIGVHYDHTLMSWWRNLERSYPTLHQHNPQKYSERFLRMFKYYLHICAALARTRNMYDWQIVFTKQ